MPELHDIFLRTPTGTDQAGPLETESSWVISVESDISNRHIVNASRNRYRAVPTPQASGDQKGVAASTYRLELHCHPRYSQPEGLSWRKVAQVLRAAWQRMTQRMRRGINSKST